MMGPDLHSLRLDLTCDFRVSLQSRLSQASASDAGRFVDERCLLIGARRSIAAQQGILPGSGQNVWLIFRFTLTRVLNSKKWWP